MDSVCPECESPITGADTACPVCGEPLKVEAATAAAGAPVVNRDALANGVENAKQLFGFLKTKANETLESARENERFAAAESDAKSLAAKAGAKLKEVGAVVSEKSAPAVAQAKVKAGEMREAAVPVVGKAQEKATSLFGQASAAVWGTYPQKEADE